MQFPWLGTQHTDSLVICLMSVVSTYVVPVSPETVHSVPIRDQFFLGIPLLHGLLKTHMSELCPIQWLFWRVYVLKAFSGSPYEFLLRVFKELTLFYSYSFCLNLNQNLDKDVLVMDTHASNKRTRKHRKQWERKVRERKSAVSNQITWESFRNVPLSLGPNTHIIIWTLPRETKPGL